MKKTIAFLLISCAVFSQEKFTLNPLRNVPKDYFLNCADSLFYYQREVAFFVTGNHVKPFKDIDPDPYLQPGFLEGKLATIAKNPSDHLLYASVADYYKSKGNQEKADEYFQKALDRLKLAPKAKDSASFYSQRAVFKHNLRLDETADMERALSINKNDSLLATSYPLYLVQRQRYSEARNLLVNFVKEKKFSKSAFSILLLADLYEKMATLPENGKARLDTINAMDLSRLATPELELINAGNKNFRNLSEMFGMIYVVYKFTLANAESKIVITDRDRDVLLAKERYFKSLLSDKNSNAYGIYFCLGWIDLLQKRYDAALLNYEKALQAFPSAKESYQFNTSQVYDAIALTRHMQKKYEPAVAALQKKLTLKSLSEDERGKTLFGIGKLYFQMGNAEKAGDYAREALAVKQSFEVDLMLSYLNFKAGAHVLADRYLEKASTNVPTDDICDFMDYIITLYISLEQYDRAEEIYRSNIKEKGMECEKCENLIKNYLVKK